MVRLPTDPVLHGENTRARLLLDIRRASHELSVERGGFRAKNTPSSIEIDNRPFFDSIGLKSVGSFARDCAHAAEIKAMEAARSCNDNDDLIARGATMGDIALLRVTRSIDLVTIGVQPEKPVVTCDEGELSLRYTKDDLGYTWDTGGVGAAYIPYSVELWVEFKDLGRE